MTKKKEAAPKRTEWYTQILRLTAFQSPESIIESANWWDDVIGDAPDERILKPKIGGSHESGSFEGGRLILDVAVNRVDWLLVAVEDIAATSEAISTIGPFNNIIDKFVPLADRWSKLATCPSLNRLAFGAVLLSPVETKSEGYQILSSYLPAVVIDPEGSSDLFYQINRPRSSEGEIRGLRVNRLSKWSVITMQIAMIGPQGSVSAVKSKENRACRLELDISTPGEYSETIEKKSINSVFTELVNLGKEIAAKGDTP
jgi:hypothetical protein